MTKIKHFKIKYFEQISYQMSKTKLHIYACLIKFHSSIFALIF